LISSCRFRRPAKISRFARRGTTNRALSIVAIGVTLSLGGTAEAAPQPRVPTRLVWDGAVCGAADDFAARVGKRSNVVRFVQRGQRLTVRLRIERRADGLDASASIEERGRAPTVRRIQSPDCDDALDALALVVAIGVEGASHAQRTPPRSRRRPPPRERPTPPIETPPEPPAPEASELPTEVPAPPPQPTPSVPPPSKTAPPAATSEPAPEPAPPAPPAPIAEPPAQREPEIDAGSRAAPAPIELGAGLSASMLIGVAPNPLWGGALWVSVGWAREGVWSPELVASGQYQRLDSFTRPGGQADFVLSSASLALCPLRFGSASLSVRPCASGTLGRLEVDGHSTFDARSSVRPWSTVGGSLEGVARAGVVEFRAVLGATAPLSRDWFSFDVPCAAGAICEADVFHRVAPVIWSGALGAGVRFW